MIRNKQQLLQKKNKKKKLEFQNNRQFQIKLMLEEQDRIANIPILDQMKQKITEILKKRQEQYEETLVKKGVDRSIIAQMMSYQKLNNNMTFNLFRKVCANSKMPNEKNRMFISEQAESINNNSENLINQVELSNSQNELVSYLNQTSNVENSQENTSSIMAIMEQNQTESEIIKQCKINHHYCKYFTIQQYKKKIFSQIHKDLFDALIRHYQLLTNWLIQHKDQFKHIIKHFKIAKIPIKQEIDENADFRWLQKYPKYAIVMEWGQKCLGGSIIQASSLLCFDKDKKFSISQYLDQRQPRAGLDYLMQLIEAINELLRYEIYHIDVASRNFIPVNEGNSTVFKFIDFQFAIFLGKDQQLHNNLAQIWSCIKKYFTERKNDEIVHRLFREILCPKYEFDILKEVQFDPGLDLYTQLFKAQNESAFKEYLRSYSKVYYRNSLKQIWDEVNINYKYPQFHKIKEIIMESQFENMIFELKKIIMMTST